MKSTEFRKYIDIINEMNDGSYDRRDTTYERMGSGRSGSSHSGRSGSSHSGSGLHGSGVGGIHRMTPTIDEKWGTTTRVNPEERGKYAGKSKAELLKSYHHLKSTGPHKQGSKEFGRMRELAFAIRAKGGWGKVKEE